jgi:hypothetical protein
MLPINVNRVNVWNVIRSWNVSDALRGLVAVKYAQLLLGNQPMAMLESRAPTPVFDFRRHLFR